MPENIVTIVAVGALGIFALCLIVYYIMRMMRGSITITLPRTAFNPGESIAGSFELKTRKNVEGQRLYVALIGQQVTETQENGETETREVYRDEQTLEEARIYEAGARRRYDFRMQAPSIEMPEFMQSGLGKALVMGARLLGGSRQRMRWKIEVRLEAKGIDLASSKKVSINTGF